MQIPRFTYRKSLKLSRNSSNTGYETDNSAEQNENYECSKTSLFRSSAWIRVSEVDIVTFTSVAILRQEVAS